MKKKPPFF